MFYLKLIMFSIVEVFETSSLAASLQFCLFLAVFSDAEACNCSWYLRLRQEMEASVAEKYCFQLHHMKGNMSFREQSGFL